MGVLSVGVPLVWDVQKTSIAPISARSVMSGFGNVSCPISYYRDINDIDGVPFQEVVKNS